MVMGVFPMLKILPCVSLEVGCGPHAKPGCHASHHSNTPLPKTDHRTPGVGSLVHADRSERSSVSVQRDQMCMHTHRPDCLGVFLNCSKSISLSYHAQSTEVKQLFLELFASPRLCSTYSDGNRNRPGQHHVLSIFRPT